MTLAENLRSLVHFDPASPLLFTSGIFLPVFALFLAGYMALGRRTTAKLAWVCLFSAWFYWKSSGSYLALLLVSVLANHGIGLWLAAKPRFPKALLAAGVVLNLAPLAFFKYANFAIENANAWFSTSRSPLELFLPVGVSFFTFQGISYLVDIHRGKANPARNLLEFSFYQTFFPHLVAGPIVRAASFLPQIAQPQAFTSLSEADDDDAHKLSGNLRRISVDAGLWLILKGLAKKAILADGLAQYSDLVFGNTAGYGGIEALMAAWSYTLQIYGDFSGYTDMAIGISLLLGYRLGDNFRSPYVSLSITDFWRRWHISLSAWLRDYVYIPLGGNRKGPALQATFLMATMLLGGLWHGASWKFVIWGGAHGILLALHKVWLATRSRHPLGRWMERGSTGARAIAWILTFHLVAALWILFRASSTEEAWSLFTGIATGWDWKVVLPFFHDRALVVALLVVGLATHLWPATSKERLRALFARMPWELKVLAFVAVVQGAMEVGAAHVQPFIYFQF
ncbi:MAG TPA: MBOAT family O-acyltransferase [Fibrobacteria bacterium]|nr:MBOAT family O-acyltransferase [Fibrobacteria bacterium]HOX50235.1 MBOAT family O-acyltransferase [Fibrobacteria bacterium]